MSFLSFFKNPKEEAYLLVHIGSHSVAGAFVVFGEDKKPHFVHNTEASFGTFRGNDFESVLFGMTKLLNSLLPRVIQEGFLNGHWKQKEKKISKVVLSFSPEWFISKAAQVHKENNIPFAVTKTILDSMREDEEAIFAEELLSNKQGPFVIFEHTILTAHLDGKDSIELFEKKTRTLDVSILMSAVPESVKHAVEHVIARHTHVPMQEIGMHSFPLVAFSFVRDTFLPDNGFLMVDIGGEVTHITLAEGDRIAGIARFPIGRNHLLREIGMTFNVPPHMAESVLSAHFKGKSIEAAFHGIEKSFANVEREWGTAFEEALFKLSSKARLPEKVYLTAEGDTALVFAEFISLQKRDKISVFRENVDVEHLHRELLSSLYTAHANSSVDEFSTMLSIFYKKMI